MRLTRLGLNSEGFDLLGVEPVAGRLPSDAEGEVVVSERLWREIGVKKALGAPDGSLVLGVVGGTTLLATLAPGWRAARVDPADTLRAE